MAGSSKITTPLNSVCFFQVCFFYCCRLHVHYFRAISKGFALHIYSSSSLPNCCYSSFLHESLDDLSERPDPLIRTSGRILFSVIDHSCDHHFITGLTLLGSLLINWYACGRMWATWREPQTTGRPWEPQQEPPDLHTAGAPSITNFTTIVL